MEGIEMNPGAMIGRSARNGPLIADLEGSHADRETRFDRILFDVRSFGLANRLRALAGYYALSLSLGIPLVVRWGFTRDCPCHFGALFEDQPFELMSPTQAISPKPTSLVVSDCPWFDIIWDRHAPWMPFPTFANQAVAFLQSLTPIRSIRVRVDAHCAQMRISEATGLHIRHTDNLAAYQRWSRKASGQFDPNAVSSPAGYLGGLRRHACRGTVFVATDDPDVVDEFGIAKEFRVISIPKTYRAADGGSLRTTDMETALMELLLLSRCATLIGTYYSSFSKLPAVIGQM